MTIHPTALVDPRAELHSSVRVGPFSIVGPHVRIGADTVIGPHCVIDGHTAIGENNRFHAYCSIGGPPQDKKYAGEPTGLRIGKDNTFREFCTINTGTLQGNEVTVIGDSNWIMAYVHIAHDCIVGDHVVFANHATLAGHVEVGDWVVMGGFSGAHQFVRIGAHAMIGMDVKLMQDVPPFVMVAGNPHAPHGINAEGLKRRGFGPDDISRIKRAFKTVYRQSLSIDAARQALAADIAVAGQGAQHIATLLTFLKTSQRGIVR
ncbi:MAG: acyl-ACP--UDP-N-acetylglucosamine O-acyltransferase [Burkholderiaceae bacterium]